MNGAGAIASPASYTAAWVGIVITLLSGSVGYGILTQRVTGNEHDLLIEQTRGEMIDSRLRVIEKEMVRIRIQLEARGLIPEGRP